MELARITPYSAILFDMNGVIVDDEHLHELAFAEVLKECGYELDHADYERWFMGRTDLDGYRSFFGAHDDSSRDADLLLRRKSDAYQRLAAGNLQPYTGVLDFIGALAAANIPLGLVTSSTRAEAAAVLDAFALISIFQTRICAEDVQRGKPDPEGYVTGAEAQGVKPAKCVVIEDAPSGVMAARKAKMQCLAVTNTHDAGSLSEATAVVDRLDAVLADALSQHYRR